MNIVQAQNCINSNNFLKKNKKIKKIFSICDHQKKYENWRRH